MESSNMFDISGLCHLLWHHSIATSHNGIQLGSCILEQRNKDRKYTSFTFDEMLDRYFQLQI